MASKRRTPKGKPAKPSKSHQRPTTSGAPVSAPGCAATAAGASSRRTPDAPPGSPAGPSLPPQVIVNSQDALLRFIDAPATEPSMPVEWGIATRWRSCWLELRQPESCVPVGRSR